MLQVQAVALISQGVHNYQCSSVPVRLPKIQISRTALRFWSNTSTSQRFRLNEESMLYHRPTRSFTILCSLPLTIAATLNTTNSTTQNESFVGYVSDPNGRGTSSLIISCLLTLILCVWSALHLNVPRYGTTNRETFILNIQWITAGIYAPELVVFTAWRQWSSAGLLSRWIAKHYTTERGSEGYCVLKHPWTLTHSFFASTGGFAIDSSSFLGTLLPKDAPKRLTVTARGIKFLAECGIVPDVPEDDIKDKSKADTLAKSMVLLQASWMMLQVIGRLIAQLPVTLIEVNTVAHVICALTMYIMWWKKPLLARAPIVISSPLLDEVFPYMYTRSTVSGKIDREHMRSQTVVKTLLASLNLYSRVPEIEYLCFREDCHNQSDIRVHNPLYSHGLTEIAEGGRLKQYSVSAECRAACKESSIIRDSSIAFFERKPQVRVNTLAYFEQDETIKSRAEAVAHYLDVGAPSESLRRSHILQDGRRCWHIEPEELLSIRSPNWPDDGLLRSVDGLVVGTILWLANFVYGGIHLAAWNDHFPSTVEKWMWRSSALYIGFCGGLWICLCTIVRKNNRLNDFWERWMDGEKGWFQNVTLGTVVFVCGASLVIARVYIVVEAFVSIRQLPAAAYDTPDWSQLIPHF